MKEERQRKEQKCRGVKDKENSNKKKKQIMSDNVIIE